MIIRILAEGQFDVDDAHLDQLNTLDGAVESAVEADDEAAFAGALLALLSTVRDLGTTHDDASIETSDLILPPSDASIEEVREMLAESTDGLIPG